MSQQEALLNEINKLQMRDMLRLYNEMAEMCFNKCVTSFRSKELNGKENSCLDLWEGCSRGVSGRSPSRIQCKNHPQLQRQDPRASPSRGNDAASRPNPKRKCGIPP